MRISVTALMSALCLVWTAELSAQAGKQRPLKVVIAGLVHGHASGFLVRYQHRPDLEVVGIAEPRRDLFDQYAKKFNLDPKLYYADLEEAIQKTHPDAVLGYTSSYDHRRVGGVGGRDHVAVLGEKPLWGGGGGGAG